MTDQVNQSSFDPSMRGDLTGVLRFVLMKFLQGIDGMLPAQVIASSRGTVSVRPLIAIITTSNKVVQRSIIPSIPVMQQGGGGFVSSFPVKAGDLGWIKSNDRDISLFLQSLVNAGPAVSQPNTARKWSFSDAVFIPDTMGYGVTIAEGDALNYVIQNLAGTVKISWGEENVTISPSVGIGTAPRAGAIIDAQSTTQAIGFPAMTSTQKAAIASPQAGYTVFDTTEGQLSTYNGGTWS